MQVPFRLLNALRLHTEIGLVAAMAVAMATFSATPLVLAPLATEFAVSTGTAALFSAAQLGSFVVGSWTAGRVVDPSRRLFVIGLVTLSAANVQMTAIKPGDIGTTKPLGVYDPLGLMTSMPDKYRR